ncbi:MAG: TldD/PmbA family protein [Candidatus Tectomicrobia bacterium]|uniref:TldD/PmbA family protein n=1 Tax=Tectimicrobiota bacterium TaxID=2528274 RepID=A0A932CSD4_UNCTE|nr:TldD/PmbA family protein [Candidatus Tectomicrobia bacterium]
MIQRNVLEEAVERGLEYLRTIPDIREAELFVASNGMLLTRLNYTSHIPCNGVEEPKSTESYGIGLQAVFRTPEGTKIGFGSEPSDLSLEGVRSALEKARQGAVSDPEFVSLPIPSIEERALYDYHDPQLMELQDPDLVGAGWKVVHGTLETLSRSERLLSLAGSPEGLKRLGLIVGGDVTILQERMAIGSYKFPQIQTDESTLLMAFITSMVEGKESKGSGWSTGTHLRDFAGDAGSEAARNAIQAIDGQRIKDGEYRIIFGPQPLTDLLNNLVLPSLSLDHFYNASSTFLGKFGRQVASEKLIIYDDGARPGLMGSKGITCEGLPTGRTNLIHHGVLMGLLSNFYETQKILRDPQAREKLGVDPTEHRLALMPRNGFRFARGGGRSFDSQPGISPTNVMVEGTHECSLEELLQQVGDGIYVGRIWYTYPINGLRAGDFTCTVVGDSYIVKGGQIVAPLKPNTVRINDNIHKVLNNILGIAREKRGTLVWAADEVVYAPEIAVEGIRVNEIASFMEGI